MKRETNIHCCECLQPIASGEQFVRFKVPGKDCYQFFHCRFHFGDCWEAQLKGSKKSVAGTR